MIISYEINTCLLMREYLSREKTRQNEENNKILIIK